MLVAISAPAGAAAAEPAPRPMHAFGASAALRPAAQNPRLESRLSSYLIRLEFTIEELQDLLERQSHLPASVQPEDADR